MDEDRNIEATFCFVDIAGYTARTDAHREMAAADLADNFAELIRTSVGPMGHLQSLIGDCAFLVFSDPLVAKEALAVLYKSVANRQNFPVGRAGLHHGAVLLRRNRHFGSAVTKTIFLILIGFVFLFSCLFSKGIEAAGTSEISIKTGRDKNKKISEIELPVPQSDRDRTYLGLEGTGTFKLNQIKTRILIIEILNSYCPHCQHEAPLVNTLHRDLEERADIKDKIKIIGIGVGDSPDEINLFKREYQVTFPLLPDPNGDIVDTLGVKVTPTFIGIRLNDRGIVEKFFFQESGFGKAPKFLKEIIKKSGLE